MWCIEKLYVFLITYCKRFHPKNSFYKKVKMTTKKIIVFESFITIGSFDYDCICKAHLLLEFFSGLSFYALK